MSIDKPNDDKLAEQRPVDEVSSMEILTRKVSNKKKAKFQLMEAKGRPVDWPTASRW